MPHHSEASWYTYIRKNAKSEFDALRKRAGILYRKHADAPPSGESSSKRQNQVAEEPAWKRRRSSVGGSAHVEDSDLEKDLEDASQFFAKGVDEEDESVVWAQLTKRVSSASCSSICAVLIF